MSIPLRKPWTLEEFFAWAENQDIRYAFDGFEPVAMTGGFAHATAIGVNLILALGNRLRGTGFRPPGPDAGLETINKAVRYPDALVTCAKFSGKARTLPGVVAVFEVVGDSRDSMRRDHFGKVREYAAVPSVLRYVIIASSLPAVTVLTRKDEERPWTHTGLSNDDILQMPEIGIEIPVAEFYGEITFEDP